jgi:hypothetical protein
MNSGSYSRREDWAASYGECEDVLVERTHIAHLERVQDRGKTDSSSGVSNPYVTWDHVVVFRRQWNGRLMGCLLKKYGT